MGRKKSIDSEVDPELEELRYAWRYNDNIVYYDDIKNYAGFVYLIENLITHKKYIGQKMTTKAHTRVVNGKKKKSRRESTWETYYGSNKNLVGDVKKYGRDNFKRIILHLCPTKSLMNYLESLEIFRSGALLGESYYNEWVSAKCSKKYLKTLEINPE